MFVFNGGLTLELVKKLENDEFYIYEKVPEKDVIIPRKNTFDYIPEYLYSEPIDYSTLAEARLKYASSFTPTKEADQEAHALIKEKKLVFNEDKWL